MLQPAAQEEARKVPELPPPELLLA